MIPGIGTLINGFAVIVSGVLARIIFKKELKNFDENLLPLGLLVLALGFRETLKRNGCGKIINIASTEGLGATIFNSPYVAAKHASVGLTKALALELGSQGITVNAVCPGPIRTGMTAGIEERSKAMFAKRMVSLRRYGHAIEVAHATVSFVLPTNSFMNGSIIPVDGGVMAHNAMFPRRLMWEEKSLKFPAKL